MKTLKWLLFILGLNLVLSSCDNQNVLNSKGTDFWRGDAFELFESVRYKFVIIDSCEYIYGEEKGDTGGSFLTHKGNCKHCQRRTKKLNTIDIEDLFN